MSKRCKLQKEYYKEFGNYKGFGKYTDHYVNWLESKVLAINYTRCCTELKGKEIPTFSEWIETLRRDKNSNLVYKGNTMSAQMLVATYKKEINPNSL